MKRKKLFLLSFLKAMAKTRIKKGTQMSCPENKTIMGFSQSACHELIIRNSF
jgi:hypothetical protein